MCAVFNDPAPNDNPSPAGLRTHVDGGLLMAKNDADLFAQGERWVQNFVVAQTKARNPFASPMVPSGLGAD
jgi:hypothetical protein